MPYCSNCGKANPDDARFCSHCGTRLAVEDVATPGVAPDSTATISIAGGERAENSSDTLFHASRPPVVLDDLFKFPLSLR